MICTHLHTLPLCDLWNNDAARPGRRGLICCVAIATVGCVGYAEPGCLQENVPQSMFKHLVLEYTTHGMYNRGPASHMMLLNEMRSLEECHKKLLRVNSKEK